MKKSIFALAAGLIAISASAASAMPNAKPAIHGNVVTEQAAYRERDGNDNFHQRSRHHGNWNRRHSNRYNYSYNGNYDDRYSQYRGWHRYGHRPRGWSNRGCVAAGPIWFCP